MGVGGVVLEDSFDDGVTLDGEDFFDLRDDVFAEFLFLGEEVLVEGFYLDALHLLSSFLLT